MAFLMRDPFWKGMYGKIGSRCGPPVTYVGVGQYSLEDTSLLEPGILLFI